jgi:ribonuclease-3
MTHDSDVARRIGYSFVNPELLREALTHRSFGLPHNERLEFLGDGVLNCAIAQILFNKYQQHPEGDLSRIRANLVNQQTLFEIAQEWRLGEQLRLGEGELKSGGAKRPSILADAIEAIIGAVFLDGGFDAAAALVGRLYDPILDSPAPMRFAKDAKTELQEFLQGRKFPTPVYTVISVTGEAHEQRFAVECAVTDLGLKCMGEGSSRRSAEQSAAQSVLQSLESLNHG